MSVEVDSLKKYIFIHKVTIINGLFQKIKMK